jgi:hypothetical protein
MAHQMRAPMAPPSQNRRNTRTRSFMSSLAKGTTSQLGEKDGSRKILKGLGFSRASRSFAFVIPNRLEPR